jgi:hypothetical protein
LLSLTSCDNEAEEQIIQEHEEDVLLISGENMKTYNVINLKI